MLQKVKSVGVFSLALLVACLCLVPAPAMATDVAVDLASTGIDMPLTIGNVTTGLGLIVTAVIAGYFAFMLIKMGLAWARKVKG